MTVRQALLLKTAGTVLLALVTAAAFAAWLRPGMLLEFANLLCS